MKRRRCVPSEGRRRLRALGLTRRQIAADIGVTPTTVGGWWRGRFVPEEVHQKALERKYGILVTCWPPRRPASLAHSSGPAPSPGSDGAPPFPRRPGRPPRAKPAALPQAPIPASCGPSAPAALQEFCARPLGGVATEDIVAELMARGVPFEYPGAPSPSHVVTLADRRNCELVAELTSRGFSFTPRRGTAA